MQQETRRTKPQTSPEHRPDQTKKKERDEEEEEEESQTKTESTQVSSLESSDCLRYSSTHFLRMGNL